MLIVHERTFFYILMIHILIVLLVCVASCADRSSAPKTLLEIIRSLGESSTLGALWKVLVALIYQMHRTCYVLFLFMQNLSYKIGLPTQNTTRVLTMYSKFNNWQTWRGNSRHWYLSLKLASWNPITSIFSPCPLKAYPPEGKVDCCE